MTTDGPLRVALLSYRSKPHCGGQGIYLRHLSRELSALGHHVEVFSGQPYPELEPGPLLHHVPSLDLYRDEDLDVVPERAELAGEVAQVDALAAAVRLAAVGEQRDAERPIGGHHAGQPPRPPLAVGVPEGRPRGLLGSEHYHRVRPVPGIGEEPNSGHWRTPGAGDRAAPPPGSVSCGNVR